MVKPLSLIRDFQSLQVGNGTLQLGRFPKQTPFPLSVEQFGHARGSNRSCFPWNIHRQFSIYFLSLQKEKSPIVSHVIDRRRFERFLFPLKSETPPYTQKVLCMMMDLFPTHLSKKNELEFVVHGPQLKHHGLRWNTTDNIKRTLSLSWCQQKPSLAAVSFCYHMADGSMNISEQGGS